MTLGGQQLVASAETEVPLEAQLVCAPEKEETSESELSPPLEPNLEPNVCSSPDDEPIPEPNVCSSPDDEPIPEPNVCSSSEDEPNPEPNVYYSPDDEPNSEPNVYYSPDDEPTPEPEVCSSPDDGYEGSPIYRTGVEYSNFYPMEKERGNPEKPSSPAAATRIYKLVLTGGPCGGKTTGQERLATFFENIGWKVFTVPEAATVLLSGGVKFGELTREQAYEFQKDILMTILRLEQVFFNQAKMFKGQNVLIICDRGAMDPSAYIDRESWRRLLEECDEDEFKLRDDRYNQVIHMVTAADGAEGFYTTANNAARQENVAAAIEQDDKTRKVWIGHPYVDIIDNSDCKGFDDKILKLIEVVCDRCGMPSQDRLSKNSKKRKWLVNSLDLERFPQFEEFEVTHDYLLTDSSDVQVRIRTRSQLKRTTYIITTRHFLNPETVETRMKINEREYLRYMAMKDKSRATLHKMRRCFAFGNQYYNLDSYVAPLPPALVGKPQMMILETYTTNLKEGEEMQLPPFMEYVKEITGDSAYSMYNFSKTPEVSVSNFQGALESKVFTDD